MIYYILEDLYWSTSCLLGYLSIKDLEVTLNFCFTRILFKEIINKFIAHSLPTIIYYLCYAVRILVVKGKVIYSYITCSYINIILVVNLVVYNIEITYLLKHYQRNLLFI